MLISISDYKTALANIPHKPGIYQYFDETGKIIYVGKAKDLRNRVSNYFTQDKNLNAKTKVLVRKIQSINFTIVDSEVDAWLLENNLIKTHQPRYNVLLKDDKTFPSIMIKNEAFPRVLTTRKIIKDGSKYFGPYANTKMMYILLGVVKRIYSLRTCNLALNKDSIAKGKFKSCLEYQIGNCKAPCIAIQSEEDYNESIFQIKEILKGHVRPVLRLLENEMNEAAGKLQFEIAQRKKEAIDLLDDYTAKSTVVSTTLTNVDVFTIMGDEISAFVNFMNVVEGAICQSYTVELRKRLEESNEELLGLAIAEFRSRGLSISDEILLSEAIEIFDDSLKITVPTIGDKKKLIDLSLKNAEYYRKNKLDQYEKTNPEARAERVLNQLKKDLRLTELPKHIECFDNSNIQGKYPVSACVVFKDAKPSKKDYRHFNVKDIDGPDDFATMEQVVYRRYKRMLDENQPLPNVVLIDGGKGQLSSALKSLVKLGIEKKVTLISIAKRLEEIYYPGDSFPMYIDKKSESLKVLQHLRDEAHRFGITFHRLQRNKATIKTELQEIPGIGKTTSEKLLIRFRSVAGIKKASTEELEKVLNKKQMLALEAFLVERGDS